jgi:hypothetical protein
MRCRTTRVTMTTAILILLLLAAGPAAAADPCETCGSEGWVACARCEGTGEVDDAKVPCPKCEGAKTIACDRCDDDGMLECPKCDGDGRITNPAWKKWRAETYWDVDKGKEPPKEIACPTCNGEKQIKCPYCEGTKKRECPKCDGKGTVEAEGTCPTCHGSGRAPCPDCAVLHKQAAGSAREALGALDDLRAKKILDDADYWRRRRDLVAKANAEAHALAEAEAEAEAVETADAEPEETTSREDLAARREALTNLLTAVTAGAIPLSLYESKRTTLGLPPREVKRVEQSFAAEHPLIQSYLEARARFRAGELDRAGYEEALAQLKS